MSVLFKQLYRDQKLEKNITDGFDPIRVPGASEREIKMCIRDSYYAENEGDLLHQSGEPHRKCADIGRNTAYR